LWTPVTDLLVKSVAQFSSVALPERDGEKKFQDKKKIVATARVAATRSSKPEESDTVKTAVVAKHEGSEFWASLKTNGANAVRLTPEEVGMFKTMFLDLCRQHAGNWLPIEAGIFLRLQAKGELKAVGTATWTGVLPGGAGIKLPCKLVVHYFRHEFLKACLQV
jgi:hypothetical protein